VTYSDSLTKPQERLLNLLVSEWERGRSVTYREIGARLHIRNDRTITDHLQALERKGWVSLTEARYSLNDCALERSTRWKRVRDFPTISECAPSPLT
jgi:SOS-response transcriptional repressor LexA